MQLCVLGPSDKQALVRFLRKWQGEYTPPLAAILDCEVYAEKLILNGRVIIAAVNETWCGMAAVYANDASSARIAFLSSIVTLPLLRGTGASKVLLAKACEIARTEGMVAIELEVSEENRRAVAFYQKNGFSVVEAPSSRSYRASVFMRKMLVRKNMAL
jgi:ribosomal protein S18 acetylase RimI-like enzyme